MKNRLLEQVRTRRESTGVPLPEPVAKEAKVEEPRPTPTRTVPEQLHVHIHTGGPTQPPVVNNYLPEQPAPVVNIEHHSHVEQPKPRAVRLDVAEDGTKRFVPE